MSDGGEPLSPAFCKNGIKRIREFNASLNVAEGTACRVSDSKLASDGPPLSGVPFWTRQVLNKICAYGHAGKMQTLFAQDGVPSASECDLCIEVPMSVVAPVLRTHSAAATAMDAFPGGMTGPSLTLFEICAHVGSPLQLEELAEAAQQQLGQRLFLGLGKAALPQVLRFLRAGATPWRRHLASCFSQEVDGQAWPPPAKRSRTGAVSDTLLHLVCCSAALLPERFAGRYSEVARWLCHVSPITLLLVDASGRTPLEVLVEAWKLQHDDANGGGVASSTDDAALLLCAFCGVRGHTGRHCQAVSDVAGRSSTAAGSPALLRALGEGFAAVVDQYPWRIASLLIGTTGFRPAVVQARSVLMRTCVDGMMDDREAAVNHSAVEALDCLLSLGEVPMLSRLSESSSLACGSLLLEAERLGTLAAASVRRRILNAVACTAAAESEAVNAQELHTRLVANEAARKAEVAVLQRRADGLEAQLSAVQRQLDQAQAQLKMVHALGINDNKVTPGGASAHDTSGSMGRLDATTLPTRAAATDPNRSPKLSSPEVFVARLRRERLVDLDDMEGAPESVREGIAQLSKSLCAAVERLAEDLYESECHFIYELVQNAEDAHRRSCPTTSTSPELRLTLTGPVMDSSAFGWGHFVSESSEGGFTEADVAAICDISASSKGLRHAHGGGGGCTIGCKGIGFKSVFTVSDRPHVLSRGFTFVFDVVGPLGKLGYVTPTWLAPGDIESLPSEVRAAHAAGRTVLFLPLKRRGLAAAIAREMDELVEQGRSTLLFLRRLERIELIQSPPKSASSPCLHGRKVTLGRLLDEPSEDRREEVAIAVAVAELPASEVAAGAGEDASTAARMVVEESHRYLLHRHCLGGGGAYSAMESGPKLPEVDLAMVELVLAFPVPPAAEEDATDAPPPRLEPIFCSLPVRAVGFGFAVHCDRFDLVANRSDVHRGSPMNQAIRNALPDAFAEACDALPTVAARALALLGEPVADPFWRLAREGVLERLTGVACVRTAGGARRPTEVLLRGSGVLREAAALLPPELPLQVCGRAFADAADATEERLLRRLGAESFSAVHLCQCLAYEGDPWPAGWVATLCNDAGVETVRSVASPFATLRALYRCLAAAVLDPPLPSDGVAPPPPTIDAALLLPELPIFPLRDGSCTRLSSGPVFRGPCPELSPARQLALAEAHALRLLDARFAVSLDTGACRLLDALGVTIPTATDVVRAALEVHLGCPVLSWTGGADVGDNNKCSRSETEEGETEASFAGNDDTKEEEEQQGEQIKEKKPDCHWLRERQRSTWSLRDGFKALCQEERERAALRASLGVLCEAWLQGSAALDGKLSGVLEEALGQLGVRGCQSVDAFDAVKIGRPRPGPLSDVVLLLDRRGRIRGPRSLLCPTFLGVGSSLSVDILSRIDMFLGAPMLCGSAACLTAGVATAAPAVNPEFVELPLSEAGHPPALAWEAFLIDGLGVQPLRPLDPRQPRAPPDLVLALGRQLGDDGPDGFWAELLGGCAVGASHVLTYVAWRIDCTVDAAWLAELPARPQKGTSGVAPLRLCELFLRSAYFPLVGAALEGAYLDLPEVGTVGRGVEIQRLLRALGAHCEVGAGGIAATLRIMCSRNCRDVAAYARIYIRAEAVHEDKNTDDEDRCNLETALRENVFHPAHKTPLNADKCVWAAPPGVILSGCIARVPLREVYAPFGERRMECYFAMLGIPAGLSTAQDYLGLLNRLLVAADDLGHKWHGAPLATVSVKLCGSGASRYEVPAEVFLAEVWTALVTIYRGMAALPASERAALQPFSPMEPLVAVPLRCPHGGPPADTSMLIVACFHDGALFRRLAVGEAFWEVAPDLARTRAAEWALAAIFPAELRNVFVDDFGIRAVVDKLTLGEGLLHKACGRGSFGGARRISQGSVCPLFSGLPCCSVQRPKTENGLPEDLLGDLSEGCHARWNDNVVAAASAAVTALRGRCETGGSPGGHLGSGDGVPPDRGVLSTAALPARSVRCPATRARRLIPSGFVDVSGGRGRISLFAVEEEGGSRPAFDRQPRGGIGRRDHNGSRGPGGREGEANKSRACSPSSSSPSSLSSRGPQRVRRAHHCHGLNGKLAALAGMLWSLAEEVFRIPGENVALVLEPHGCCGDCGHQDFGASWPLLFPVGLRAEVGEDPAFWFSEFCHALAHRSEGPEHSSRHARVGQALLARYLPAFSRAFGRSLRPQ